MGFLCCNGASMLCSFGTAPSTLAVTPANKVQSVNAPSATIMDNKPNVNIPPFGMCTSMANPAVASATSAASGVLTPQPCMPVTVAPWAPGSPTVTIGMFPALNNNSKLMCNWGGVISITFAGQTQVQIP